MEEQSLLRRLRRRDQRALEQLLREYGAYVASVARGRSRGLLAEEDLEEIVSDVFVALWTHAGELHPGHIRQWLGSVARNKTVDRLRRYDLSVPLEDAVLPVEDTLWDQIAQKERETLVADALRRLEPKDQEIFFRYYDLCETAQEISEKMGMNPSTVRTRLSRGRERLRQILCEGGFFDEVEA